jgi:hypothetical protein
MHTDIHALNRIRTHDLSVQVGEDSSCLRPHGHCVRHMKTCIRMNEFCPSNGALLENKIDS